MIKYLGAGSLANTFDMCMYAGMMHGCMSVWMYGCMDVWMYGCMDGRMDGRTDGRMDGWIDGCTYVCMYVPAATRLVFAGSS